MRESEDGWLWRWRSPSCRSDESWLRRDRSGVTLVFAPLKPTASIVLENIAPQTSGGPAMSTVPIDGIDTTRIRGQLMLFTPSYRVATTHNHSRSVELKTEPACGSVTLR